MQTIYRCIVWQDDPQQGDTPMKARASKAARDPISVTAYGNQLLTFTLPDNETFDDIAQGNAVLASIGPYYSNTVGESPGPATLPDVPLSGAVRKITSVLPSFIPWWWITGQPSTWPTTPAISTPTSGAAKPYSY